MSTAPPPRHLPRAVSSEMPRLMGGRQLARIRAIAESTPLPEERALADAAVLTAWLTPAQRSRYARSLRSGPGPEEFAERLADERRVALEEDHEALVEELELAAAAQRAARQTPWRVLEGLLLLTALGLLASVAVLDAWPRDRASALTLSAYPEELAWLVGGAALSLLVAAVVGSVATRRRDRALLDWAVDRPGQLGRGLPMAIGPQRESAGPAILRALGPALLLAAGVLALVAGAAVLLIALLAVGESDLLTSSLAALVGGAVLIAAAALWSHLNGRRLERVVRRARAIEWVGSATSGSATPAV
ncbi:hypothetical protein V1260_00540 [Brachybacterium sp. J144]|uniref:hypothetical protein n=1 Tax=Brachybacterium sp. J144 TaxID=3116487 RepID=UPI002E791E84|nr:hypothetical protein [Brachybacterium sp. J144]MEE1649275.1 hypothetical protein [Brachybacterium sp. J144]